MKSINDKILENYINTINVPIIVVFWYELCGSCDIMKNIMEEIKKNFKKKIKVLKININYNKYSSEKFSINSAPTIIIIFKKILILKKSGITNRNFIEKFIKKYL
ncbi:thioredoxin 1 redox factor [Candidatus Nasuia deltocephalinicola str. NAS-ALF]|uniref:Thioredoxin 1 redox factor n=1 Tax=Candidatus Nasuia deltocephalinicola str. NAS-ALF TaxID=1343077 RepID=S5SY34_9PROT|nr:thioredoxin 1 redox factor [Candidatus Nasuia deltocephalinicola str. NAS-ALF]